MAVPPMVISPIETRPSLDTTREKATEGVGGDGGRGEKSLGSVLAVWPCFSCDANAAADPKVLGHLEHS